MDVQLHMLVLQMLQQTADGLAAAIKAPIGEIETGAETADLFEDRMELTIKRVACIRDIVQQGYASPEQLTILWNDVDDEREYHQKQRQQKTTDGWELEQGAH